MEFSLITTIIIILVSVIIIVCSIGIIVASRFQNKQRKKYNEINNIINQNKNAIFQVKDGLTKEEINNIDSKIDVDLLMCQLFNTYLELENKIKNHDTNLDDILFGHLKEFNISRIKNYKSNGFCDINDGIDLINYSIVEYNKKKLRFRITINCFSYKLVNNQIVSGSNLEKLQKIILLDYQKVDDKWLISAYNKIYEQKLSN